MMDIGYPGRQTIWERLLTLYPTGLQGRKAAFGSADGKEPSLIYSKYGDYGLLPAFIHAFVTMDYITILISVSILDIILPVSIIFTGKNRSISNFKLCKWIALFIFK